MEVELMCARLAVQNETVSGQSRDQLASRQAAQVREIDPHTSDNHCHLRLAGHLHLIGGFGRQRLSMLQQALHNHLNHFLYVLESFLLGVAPGGATLPHQRRTVRVPTLAVRLYHDPEVVGLHCLLSVCHIPAMVGQALPPAHPPGTDKPDMNFWLTFPEIRCQACPSPVYPASYFLSFLSIFPSLSKHPRRVCLVLVRPPLFSARRIVGIHILVIPACQRHRKHQVVMRPFPPRRVLLVAAERYLHLHRRHLFHQGRTVLQSCRDPQHPALQQRLLAKCYWNCKQNVRNGQTTPFTSKTPCPLGVE